MSAVTHSCALSPRNARLARLAAYCEPLAIIPRSASLYTKWIALPNWSAYRSAEFGHGQFLFVNNTVCEFTWIRNVDAKVADSVAVFNTKPY